MTDAVFFVVERNAGGEFPGIYYDLMPDRLTLRLDRLDDPEMWLAQDLADLYRRYVFLRDHNRLVHNLADPPLATETVRKIGEYWEPSPMPRPEGWDQEAADAEFNRRYRSP